MDYNFLKTFLLLLPQSSKINWVSKPHNGLKKLSCYLVTNWQLILFQNLYSKLTETATKNWSECTGVSCQVPTLSTLWSLQQIWGPQNGTIYSKLSLPTRKHEGPLSHPPASRSNPILIFQILAAIIPLMPTWALGQKLSSQLLAQSQILWCQENLLMALWLDIPPKAHDHRWGFWNVGLGGTHSSLVMNRVHLPYRLLPWFSTSQSPGNRNSFFSTVLLSYMPLCLGTCQLWIKLN